MRFILAIIVTFLCTQCVINNNVVKRSYVSLSNTDSTTKVNSANQPIVLFFESEPINFTYKKIGLVEVQGAEYSTETEIIDHLKYEAWKNYSNAIINIKKSTKVIEERASNSDPKQKRQFNTSVYSGISVRIPDSLFNTIVATQNSNTNFIQTSQQYDKQKGNAFVTGLVAVLLLAVGFAIYIAVNKGK